MIYAAYISTKAIYNVIIFMYIRTFSICVKYMYIWMYLCTYTYDSIYVYSHELL